VTGDAAYQRALYWANRDEHLRKAREYRQRRPDVYARTKATTPERAARAWADRLLRKYGLTTEQYESMLAAQDGRCAICRQPETRTVHGVVSRLAVDHDHRTARVRGLVCHLCNRAIGLLQDDPDLLRAAAEYLDSHALAS
jgi:hypothetical protein